MSNHYEPIASIGQISFPITFEPDLDLTQFVPQPKSEFLAIDEAGEFTRFLAWTNPALLSDDGTMNVGLTGIELLEVGNVYDRQGSD